jgi:hypothetical protein
MCTQLTTALPKRAEAGAIPDGDTRST